MSLRNTVNKDLLSGLNGWPEFQPRRAATPCSLDAQRILQMTLPAVHPEEAKFNFRRATAKSQRRTASEVFQPEFYPRREAIHDQGLYAASLQKTSPEVNSGDAEVKVH